jgi:hypothetical protein
MISNGIKFTEKGKVNVAVAVHDEIDEDNVSRFFNILFIIFFLTVHLAICRV